MLMLAQVIGIALTHAAFGEARREGIAAIGAGCKAAQRERITDVLAGRRIARVLQAFLDALKHLERDQRVVLALAQGHTPFLGLHHPAPGALHIKQHEEMIALSAPP